jgi:hypothetical protein
VFAVGFGMAGTSNGIESLLAGLLVLALAAFAWPVIARFFTFATIQASSSGLAAVLGFAAGTASQSGGGGTAGINPSRWSMAAENRTMAARGAFEGAATNAPHLGAAGGASGGAGAAGGAGGGGAAAAAGIGWAIGKANQVGAVLAGRMEQTAAHAGMHGAYPYSTVPGGQRTAPRPAPQPPLQEAPPPSEPTPHTGISEEDQ